ncbi:MAG: hypothetical protein QMD77_04130 [Patescibacteria group bacterium]|nr:hypothetical protein [Patescibacteria group bacterium]
MASQIAHVVYAKKYLDRHPAMNADLFLLGTLLPDVRRVTDEVKRKDTHIIYKELDLELKDLSPFEAGYRFHLWCDMRREEILNKYDFYSLKRTNAIDPTAKLVEDELVYDKYKNWEKLRWLLNNPPEIKTELPVSRETIERWYSIIAKYFEKKPDDKTIKAFLFKQRKLRGQTDEIIDGVKKLKENKKATDILKRVCEEII